MATRDEINAKWQQARTAFSGTDEQFLATPQGQGIRDELAGHYASLSDPAEIGSQLAYHQGRVDDPVYGASARQFVNTLSAKQTQANQARTAPAPAYAAPSAPVYTAPPPRVVPEQDVGVQTRVAGMLQQNSPLMQAARTEGLKAGNRRGLMNSTMATQAGTRAALDVVVPIASQEAGQAQQTNLSSQGYQQEGMLQAPRLISAEGIAARQEAGAERRLGMEIGSRETISAADRAARASELLREITSRENIAKLGEAGANTRAAAELTSRQNLSANEIAANQTNAVRDAVAQANQSYSAAYNAIMGNPNIGAQDRATYLQSIETRRQADLILIESLFNVDLNWETTGTPTAPNAGGGAG